jgi:hypothetical protein
MDRSTGSRELFRQREEKGEKMKRILAVLAMVVALAIPVAAQASQGPQNSYQCPSASKGACARAGHHG